MFEFLKQLKIIVVIEKYQRFMLVQVHLVLMHVKAVQESYNISIMKLDLSFKIVQPKYSVMTYKADN